KGLFVFGGTCIGSLILSWRQGDGCLRQVLVVDLAGLALANSSITISFGWFKLGVRATND
ncbi:MAG: hypothetical protein COA42_08065, partial [Alteromonadaceae bacterium]